MKPLRCEVLEPHRLRASQLEEMFQLFSVYYEVVAFPRFVSDMREKNFLLLLLDGENQVRGFSTLSVLDVELEGQPRRALFSGDTIVDHQFWGQQTLVLEWCRLAGHLKSQRPELPLYWFLICKGHRTYRFLHCFTHQYYPNSRTPPTAEMKSWMDFLAVVKFGTAYNPETGVIDFGRSQGQLRAMWAAAEKACHNAEARYFVQLNPGYAEGTELMCLAELAVENLRGLARRAFQEGMSRGCMASTASDVAAAS